MDLEKEWLNRKEYFDMSMIFLYVFIMTTFLFFFQTIWKLIFYIHPTDSSIPDFYLDISYIGTVQKQDGKFQKKIPIYKGHEYLIGSHFQCDIHLPRQFDLSCLGRIIADHSSFDFQLEQGMAQILGKSVYIPSGETVTLQKGEILRFNNWIICITSKN